MQVKRYYNCRKKGNDPACGWSHQGMERPARWDKAMVRKFRRDKGTAQQEPFSFAKLCDSIALSDGRRSSRNGDVARNRRYEDLGRMVLLLLERQSKIGAHTDWTIDSELIGLTVLDVFMEEGLAAMWVRYSLVFHELDTLPYNEQRVRLDRNWEDATTRIQKRKRPQ